MDQQYSWKQLKYKHVLTEKEAAVYLGTSRSFLRRDRSEGPRANRLVGPSYIRAGRMIRYLRSDLDDWLAHHHMEHPLSVSDSTQDMEENPPLSDLIDEKAVDNQDKQ